MNTVRRTLALILALPLAVLICPACNPSASPHTPQMEKQAGTGSPACPGIHPDLYNKCYGCAPLEERLYNATRTTGIREDIKDKVLQCVRAGADLTIASVELARGIVGGCLEDSNNKNPKYQEALVAAYTKAWSDPTLAEAQDGYKACVASVRACGASKCDGDGVSNAFHFLPPPAGAANVEPAQPANSIQPE